MDGDEGRGTVGQMQGLSAQLADGDRTPEQTARRRGAERHNSHRLHDRAFEIEPNLAALDFVGVGTLVQAALAAHVVLEMLYRMGDEDLRARNSRVRQRTVEDASGRADERLAAEVFLVAGLLADEHDVRGPAALARHRLRCVFVERAARARVLGLGKLRQRIDLGRKLNIKLRLFSHRTLLANRRRPSPVNAWPRRQYGAAASLLPLA